LFLARRLGFHGLLIFELAVIHHTADRRVGIWGDFDEVISLVVSVTLSISDGKNAYLGSIDTNKAASAGTDVIVDPKFLSAYSSPPMIVRLHNIDLTVSDNTK